MNEFTVTEDASALLEVLTDSLDMSVQDAHFLLECHGEEVMPVPGDVSYHEAARTLLTLAVEWGDYDFDEFLGDEPV